MNKIQPGYMALFYHSGSIVSGLVTGIDGNLIKLYGSDGASHVLPEARICLCGEEVYDVAEPAASLNEFLLEISSNTAILDVALSVLADGTARDFHSITEELTDLNDAQRFALFIGLNRSTSTVSHKKGLYRLLSESERRNMESAERQHQERQTYLDQVRAFILAHPERASDQLATDDFNSKLSAELRLLQMEQSPQDLASVIRKALPNKDISLSIIELRQALRELAADTDPALATSGLPVRINTEMSGFQATSHLPIGDSELEAICVDDADSRDYDDAFSLSKTSGGWRIGIHISDVAACIDPGSELFRTALDRASSIYLPSETVNMLPDLLAEDALSLKAGRQRAVLSLYCDVTDDLRMLDCHYKRESILVSSNISYSELESRLRSGKYQPVKAFCDSLRSERGSANQLSGNDPVYNVKVTNGRISLKKIDFSSPARTMIEELMVLYNRLMAERAYDSGIPFLYRNISSLEEPSLTEDELSSEQATNLVQMPSQAYISTQPLFHPGIGAKAYLHASSPIRRIVDLINQYQFTAWLEKRPEPFNLEFLDAELPRIGKRLLLQKEVARQSERYWLLRYLRQDWMGRPLDAVFVKSLRRGAVFELLPWRKRIIVECDTLPPAGYELKLLIHKVDLKTQICQADVIV